MATTIDKDYFRTAKEATIQLKVRNDVATKSDIEYDIHITNFSHAELYYSGGLRLRVFRVQGAGSEYYPHLTVYKNGEVDYSETLSTAGVYSGQTYTNFINSVKRNWDSTKYTELENIDDAINNWFEFVGQGRDLYYTDYIIYQTDTVANCNEGIEIVNAGGEGVFAIGYQFYNFMTAQDCNEIVFTNDPGTDGYDYVSSAYNDNFFEIPEGRAKTGEGFSFPYYTGLGTFALGTRSDYNGNVPFWKDANPLSTNIIPNIVNGWTDYISALDNFHPFKGIQWDVWVDGSGQSMSITIVPTFIGERENQNCFIEFGEEEPKISDDPVDAEVIYKFDDPTAFRLFTNGETYDTTWSYMWYIKNNSDPDLSKARLPMKVYYYDENNERQGQISFMLPSFIPSDITVDKIPEFLDSWKKGVLENGDGDGPLNNTDKSKVIFHGGLYNGDQYTDDDDISDDIDDSDGYNGVGLLTTQYAMTAKRTQQLGWKLWGASFVELIEKVNNNPIENVISLKVFPFDLSGHDEVVKLGNVEMDVNGSRIESTDYNYRKEIGTFTVKKKYNSFLDFAPFTKVSIYLPFIGIKDLDTSFIMGKTITLRYITDIITGACKAELRYNGALFADYEGNMGIDIALAASNRAQVEAAFIANTVSSVTRNIGGIVGGASGGSGGSGGLGQVSAAGAKAGAITGLANIGSDLLQSALNQYHTTSTGAPSPACTAYQTRDAFLIYDRPTYQELKAFNATRGRMCMLSRTIGNLSGYTQVTPMIDLSDIPCTDFERQELIRILSSGFFA